MLSPALLLVAAVDFRQAIVTIIPQQESIAICYELHGACMLLVNAN